MSLEKENTTQMLLLETRPMQAPSGEIDADLKKEQNQFVDQHNKISCDIHQSYISTNGLKP